MVAAPLTSTVVEDSGVAVRRLPSPAPFLFKAKAVPNARRQASSVAIVSPTKIAVLLPITYSSQVLPPRLVRSSLLLYFTTTNSSSALGNLAAQILENFQLFTIQSNALAMTGAFGVRLQRHLCAALACAEFTQSKAEVILSLFGGDEAVYDSIKGCVEDVFAKETTLPVRELVSLSSKLLAVQTEILLRPNAKHVVYTDAEFKRAASGNSVLAPRSSWEPRLPRASTIKLQIAPPALS